MTLTEILKELPNLTSAERLSLIEAAAHLNRKELLQKSEEAWSEEQQQMALAAQALLPDYEADGELTIFTTLDGEDFHAWG